MSYYSMLEELPPYPNAYVAVRLFGQPEDEPLTHIELRSTSPDLFLFQLKTQLGLRSSDCIAAIARLHDGKVFRVLTRQHVIDITTNSSCNNHVFLVVVIDPTEAVTAQVELMTHISSKETQLKRELAKLSHTKKMIMALGNVFCLPN